VIDAPVFERSATEAAMGDPAVVYLRYRLVPTDPATEFRAPAIDRETDDWALHVGPEGEGLAGVFGVMSIRPAGAPSDLEVRPEVEALFTCKTHYHDASAAHAAVLPVLEAWQLEESLREAGRRPRFQFEFAGSLVVDHAPQPGQEAQYVSTVGGSFYVRPKEQPVLVEAWSAPPTNLAVNEHARTLWQRWDRYLRGEDTLPVAAYACLTYLTATFGPGDREAAAALGVSRGVLRKVSELSSRVGDDETARKFDRQPRRAHTPEEVAFLERSVTALIRRVGELAAAADPSTLRQLDLTDLGG
jgi:hypothetical protein